METDFPEIEERFAADAWREPVYVEHKITHEDLTAATEAWLKAGGCITQVESGVQNAVGSQFNSRSVGESPVALQASVGQSLAAKARQARRAVIDTERVEKLQVLLLGETNRADVCAALEISDKILQRLLEQYFPGDKSVAHLRRKWRDEDQPKVVQLRDDEWKLAHGRIVKIDDIPHKRCPSCKEDKPTSQFYECSSHASGIKTYCKPCEKALGAIRWGKGGSNEQPSAA
ncbi:hypothetical protein [Pseudomonas nitroreducens]|uniref:Uncharacterized protein n=1 Tax=Pseudomonas nitroreducens TaxID=46680 RepID=A0A6G6IWY6_PSENT|nr:hypothetical protein [Pseudomonas nitroreducens]QIE86741.1 hypothetical protein G5B91_10825 [Pseudomonas nitroreducens]